MAFKCSIISIPLEEMSASRHARPLLEPTRTSPNIAQPAKSVQQTRFQTTSLLHAARKLGKLFLDTEQAYRSTFPQDAYAVCADPALCRCGAWFKPRLDFWVVHKVSAVIQLVDGLLWPVEPGDMDVL